jgi:protein tyrosine phosphatase (PTP) superfamily phosphohydrolase (DUF442 family)
MLKLLTAFMIVLFLAVSSHAAAAPETERTRLNEIERQLKGDVPRLVCLDSNFSTGAQPTEQAYAKAAASGFRAVLSLRAGNEGVDLSRERMLVEKAKMRYFNIPVISRAPRAEQADAFILVVKDKSNHPMLINCASANRVGAFMMTYRVLEQGWSEEKALEEAKKIGLNSDGLKKFAQDYIAQRKSKPQP